jgi:hypothetical protein
VKHLIRHLLQAVRHHGRELVQPAVHPVEAGCLRVKPVMDRLEPGIALVQLPSELRDRHVDQVETITELPELVELGPAPATEESHAPEPTTKPGRTL